MTKKTVRDRAEERRNERDAKARVVPMAMPGNPAPALAGPNTKISTIAPGLAKGPINMPGGTVTSVYERVPRLPCPVCGGLIAVSLHDLLSAASFNCPVCLTSMNMNRTASQDALHHMQNFYVAAKDITLG